MSLGEPLKKAIDELIPAKWQTLVITPVLLFALGGATTLVYANKRAEGVKDTAKQEKIHEELEAVTRRVDLREAHDEDRDRRLISVERSVLQIQLDLATALGNRQRAREAQSKLDTLPPEEPR